MAAVGRRTRYHPPALGHDVGIFHFVLERTIEDECRSEIEEYDACFLYHFGVRTQKIKLWRKEEKSECHQGFGQFGGIAVWRHGRECVFRRVLPVDVDII